MPDILRITRRRFLKSAAAGAAVATVAGNPWARIRSGPEAGSRVALVKTDDRVQGVKAALTLIPFDSPRGMKVFIKPNFNTADPPPGSTHNDTLRALALELKTRGAAGFSIGDRCGPGDTKKVMTDKGIPSLAADLGAELVNFEELGPEGWIHLNPPGSHWKDGFDFARPLAESEYPAAICCLKTHGFGGIFTMSLKLTVGAVHRRFMRELHGSPDQRRMIAEINLGYRPRIIVMDGIEAFTDGGPMTGALARPGVVLASTDRVALDAVGLAILKNLGSNEAVMSRNIFDQEQISRAVELGLGASGPGRIELVTGDPASERYAGTLRAILDRG